MRHRFLAPLAALSMLAAACSGSVRHAAVATTAPAPRAYAPNPDVIPPVITPAYVNAVFAVLNHINGNATRLIIAADEVTPRALSELRSIYSPALLAVEIKVFKSGLTDGLPNLRSPVGDRVTTVVSIVSASPQCIFVETSSSLSAVERVPTASPADEYWELVPKQADQAIGGLNPTPWSLANNRDYLKPTKMADSCL